MRVASNDSVLWVIYRVNKTLQEHGLKFVCTGPADTGLGLEFKLITLLEDGKPNAT